MSLAPWRSFVEISRIGSISGAAASTGYTQSALSRQVAGLERTVGVALLHRLPRGIQLTPAGEALLPHARALVSEADRGLRAARSARSASPGIVIGSVPSAAAALVPLALRDVTSRQRLEWSLVVDTSAELVERLVAGEVDCAIVTDAPPGLPSLDGLMGRHVGDDEMVVTLDSAHPLADAASSVDLVDLRDELWVEDNSGSETMLRHLAARAGFEPYVDRTPNDLLTKTALVAAGGAVAMIPGLLSPALPATLRTIRIQDAPRRGIFLISPTEPHPSVDAILEALARRFGDVFS